MDKVLFPEYNMSEDAGHVLKGEFLITNMFGEDILKVNVMFEFYDGQGKHPDREQWLFGDRISAGQSMSHASVERCFVNAASEDMKCRMVDFEVATQ
jgi:hypothetical protein